VLLGMLVLELIERPS